MATRPFSIKRTAEFLGLSDDLPLQAPEDGASTLVNFYRDRRKLVRRGGQSVLGSAALSPDQDLKGLTWTKIDDTEHLVGVHSGDIVDFLHASVGSIVGNGTDRLPGSGSADSNGAWVEGDLVLGNGIDPNVRYNGEVAFSAQFTRASNQSLSNSTDTTFNMADHDFAIACWVYLDSLSAGNDRDIFTLWHESDAAKCAFTLYYGGGSNRFSFSVRTAAATTVTVDEATSPSAGAWYFLVAWHDGTANNIHLQVNNGTVRTAAVADGGLNAIGPATNPLRVGAITATAGGTTYHMDGRVDSLGFWKTAVGSGGILTAAIRTSLYNSGRGKVYSQLTATETAGLVRWWDLDEHTGSRTDEVAGIVLTASASSPTYAAGISAMLPVARQMVQAVTTAPSVNMPTPGTHLEAAAGIWEYRISFLNADGVYGEAGPTGSDTHTTASFDSFLSSIPLCPAGQDCSGRRIWRRSGGSTTFQKVTDILDNTTTSYTDDTDNADLGEDLVEFNAAFPPAQNLREWMGRLVGSGNADEPEVLFISNFEEHYYCPTVPDVDDPNQGIRLRLQGRAAGKITGHQVHGGMVAVFTGGAGYLVQGNQPRNFLVQQFTAHGCVAHRTIVSARDLLIWLANDGVYAWNGQQVQRISDDVRTTLDALTAAQLAGAHAVLFEDRYYLFWATGALAFDLEYRLWTELDNNLWRIATASEFVSGNRQRLWGAHEGHARVYQLETGTTDALPAAATAITATWASKDWDMGLPGRDKRAHYLETKFRKSTGTAKITLYRGTGESFQTLFHDLREADHPQATISRKLQSVAEEGRDEHFRIEVTVSSTAAEVELLAAGLMYSLAS